MEHPAQPSRRPEQPASPLQTPHPGPGSAPRAEMPVTDGTPTACRQKNAADFLAGNTPGVMAAYGGGDREPGSPIPTLESEDAVRHLVQWRQEAPYG